jgi:hypothetical protein
VRRINRDLAICVLIATGEDICRGILGSWTEYNNKIIVGQNFCPSSLSGGKLLNNYKIFQDSVVGKDLDAGRGILEFGTPIL